MYQHDSVITTQFMRKSISVHSCHLFTRRKKKKHIAGFFFFFAAGYRVISEQARKESISERISRGAPFQLPVWVSVSPTLSYYLSLFLYLPSPSRLLSYHLSLSLSTSSLFHCSETPFLFSSSPIFLSVETQLFVSLYSHFSQKASIHPFLLNLSPLNPWYGLFHRFQVRLCLYSNHQIKFQPFKTCGHVRLISQIQACLCITNSILRRRRPLLNFILLLWRVYHVIFHVLMSVCRARQKLVFFPVPTGFTCQSPHSFPKI